MSVKDLVNKAINDDLVSVKETFNGEMSTRINDLLAVKKMEIAKNYFGQKE